MADKSSPGVPRVDREGVYEQNSIARSCARVGARSSPANPPNKRRGSMGERPERRQPGSNIGGGEIGMRRDTKYSLGSVEPWIRHRPVKGRRRSANEMTATIGRW